jgi:MFS family permease
MGSDEQLERKGKWMALTAALLGWMFDGLEMGLFPLVARPALRDLLGKSDDKVIGLWFAVATAGFLVGAATGGVLFGWLGDRIGRVRAMTLSVLTYALFSGLCGVATAAWQVAVLRFVSALGMGGEWSLGVALVMEVWPNRSRALLAGLIGAAANVGYMLIAVLGLALGLVLDRIHGWLLSVGLPQSWVSALVAHSGWRLLMLLGATPALLTFLIRLFVPESARWQEEQKRGRTSHWATRDLLGVCVGAAGAGVIIYLWAADLPMALRVSGTVVALAVTTAGYLYPIVRYLQRGDTDGGQGVGGTWRPTVGRMLLAACLSGVALLATWASIQWAPVWADQLSEREAAPEIRATVIASLGLGGNGPYGCAEAQLLWASPRALIKTPQAKAYTQIWSGFGAVVGCVLAAYLGDWLGRRLSYTVLCLGALGSALLFFQGNDHYGPPFLASVFLAGALTASFYGWLPLYLPELFRTRVRATGQGFGFNFGRILAAVGVLQTGNLMGLFEGGYPQACSVMSLIYLVGVGLIWLAPETKGQPLPE